MFNNLFDTLAHLPVTKIAGQVAEHFTLQMIPIVTSEVASGKTMLIPAYCAELLKEDPSDRVVYVLEPTRFLANNAAESLRQLLGKAQENRIGCINSNRSDDDSLVHPDNRIIFTTVGYALSSGILKNKSNFILDEAHETSIDLSLTKAYLHHRLEQGDLINVAILSATIDITNEMEYWGDNAVHFTTEGSAYPTEFLHRPAFSLTESVMTLIEEHQRKGILVFAAGVEEIDEAVSAISLRLMSADLDFEVASVHGNSNGDQRRAASAMPQADIKILVGTNVLESGVSLPWVDSGVSSGDTKIMHVNGNVRRLNKEELPRWRIHQQMGRVSRFKPGVFILADVKPLESRPEMSSPDIVRLPLTELVMRCTAFPDIHIHDLQFTKREQPKPGAIAKAISTLVEYGLIEEEDDGYISLTDDGRLIQPLPLSYRAAVATCEAHRMGKLAEMLPLIAMLDMGDMRFDFRTPMTGSSWTMSDAVHQTMTIVQYFSDRSMSYNRRRDLSSHYNVNLKKLQEYNALLADLEKKTSTRAKFSCYYNTTDEEARSAFDKVTKQVIFRSMITETYPYKAIFGEVRIPTTYQGDIPYNSAKITNTTAVDASYGTNPIMCSGTVRIISPKRGFPFAVLEGVTVFLPEDMKYLIERFGKDTFVRIAAATTMPTALSDLLDGPKRYQPTRSIFRDPDYNDFLGLDTKEVPPEPVPAAPVQGSFGNLLEAALKGKK